MNDYRCSDFCPEFSSIPKKKAQLEKKITAESQYKNFYNAIKPRGSKYNRDFSAIYNSKCSYCGVSIDIQSHQLFEVDHFINKAHPDVDNKKDLDTKDNLMFACHTCNRKKRDFAIHLNKKAKSGLSYKDLLNPDQKHIMNVFTRDSHYRIQIAPQYASDPHVKSFYNKLLFHHPIRQLDFLLLELTGLIEKCKNVQIKASLLEIKDLLIRARNRGTTE